MAKDPKNPTGSDIVAERLRKEREGKKAPKKKRQRLISFEVIPHTPKHHSHQRAKAQTAPAKQALTPAKEKPKMHTIPTWRRVAVWIFIILFIMWYFTNNYIKNVKIEELQSADSGLTPTYEEQTQKIIELEAEVSRLKGVS